MAITLVGTTVGNGTTANFSVSLPAGVQENDVVVVVTSISSTSNLNPGVNTSGYAELADLYANDTRDANLSVSWKRMGATPDTTVEILGSGSGTIPVSAIVRVYRGVDTTTAIDVTTTTATNLNGSRANAPSITTVTNGAWVLACMASTGDGTPTDFTGPSGMNNFIQEQGVVAGVRSTITSLADIERATAGAYDPAALTGGESTSSDSWCACTVALRPAPNSAPATPTLSTPANLAEVTDDTPTLEFSTTDADADSIRYQVQIDTVNTFDSTPVAETYYFDASDAGPTDASSAWTNDSNAFDGSTSTNAGNGGVSGTLSAEGTNAPASGSAITQVRARIYADVGFGSVLDAYIREDTAGSGNLLGTISDANMPATPGWSSYVTLSAPGGGWTWAKVQSLAVDLTGQAGVGNCSVYRVEIEVTSGGPLLERISGTDSGFANVTTPADTDPFNSGDTISFTAQAGNELPNDVYYWRVRAIDPSGTNTWSAWSATREFTVNVSSGPSPLDASTGSFTLTGVATGLTRNLVLVATQVSFTLTGVANTMTRVYTLTADTASFADTFIDATFLRSYQVTCDTGGLTITGISADTLFNRLVPASTGAFALAGLSNTIAKGYIFIAEQVTFSLTTVTATFARAYVLPGEPIAFALTGITAGTAKQYWLTADTQSYTIAGFAVSFPRASVMLASTGVFSLTGQDAALNRAYVMGAGSGTFAVSGVTAVAAYNRLLPADTTAFEVSAVSATFVRSFVISAGVGAISVTGISADTLKGFLLTAEKATFTLSGIAAIPAKLAVFPADAGSFSLNATSALFLRGRVLDATRQTYELATVAVALLRAQRFPADTATFALVLQEADQLLARAVIADPASYAAQGTETALLASLVLTAETGAFALEGVEAFIQATGRFAADAGEFTLTGNDAVITRHLTLTAETASFILAGAEPDISTGLMLVAEPSVFTVSGVATDIRRDALIDANPALFTGPDSSADITVSRLAEPISAFYELNTFDVELGTGVSVVFEPGSFLLSSSPTELSIDSSGALVCDGSGFFTPNPSPFAGQPSPFGTKIDPYSEGPIQLSPRTQRHYGHLCPPSEN